jgi:3-dehydroquinate synthase
MGTLISEKTVASSSFPYRVYVGRGILDRVRDVPAYKNADRIAVLVSSNVYNLHKEKIESVFAPGTHLYITLEDGEHTKEFSRLEAVLCKMLKGGCTRKSCIVAIGGGVVGDFAGFAAGVYMRGISVIQIPTTLLSVADSSIGGKTAVNIGAGKNIAGLFYPPSAVIQDVDFLDTLSDDEFINGLSECVKHAFIGSRELFDIIETASVADLRKKDVLEKFVALSSGLKIDVVSRDEHENGERAILNFGHTVGHSIESAMNYGISHGGAVAIGMIAVSRISNRMGFLDGDSLRKIESIIERFGIAPKIMLPPADELIRHMMFDKKNSAGKIRFVLLKGLFIPIYNAEADMSIVRDVLTEIA